ncbi:MAG: glycosyltransferase family 2 protein [Crocinitomicaceae bacterium]|nr:glycosyltransferase family 2 protein [Crocinitomicaceae bacterium]MDG1776680.1 glycosyltransferase family 2 protein [Crocinitomicaceae bacterium]
MKISATIITLNEERNIERCICSLKNVADEIIVLDSNSTDRTEEICLKHKVTFVKRDWEGYAASKNYLNTLANYNYILSMDADEAVDAELEQELLKVKEVESPELYSVNRMTNYCGKWIKHAGWYPDVKTRLFPKEGCFWDGEFVHEELVCPKELKTTQLKGHLSHYSYYSYKDHRQRADKYSVLTAQKMHKAGKRASALKPLLSGVTRFISMYVLKAGFLDGKMGFKIAQISAQSNVFKYQELRRLNQAK